MAKFLTTSGVSHKIEEIITGARSRLVLICPYLQLSKTLLERLKDADSRKVKIMIVCKGELRDNQKSLLSELSNLDLYYSENLHAKCYLNENLMVITSMNLYEFSEKTNREMGVLISRDRDEDLFNEAEKEVKSILDSSKRVQLGKQISDDNLIHKPTKEGYAEHNHGFCIRCRRRINYDPDRPYCRECYHVWAEFENPLYPEEHCHKCGKPEATSMDKPLCRPCYLKEQCYA